MDSPGIPSTSTDGGNFSEPLSKKQKMEDSTEYQVFEMDPETICQILKSESEIKEEDDELEECESFQVPAELPVHFPTIWSTSASVRAHFPFTGKQGFKLAPPQTPMASFELLFTPEFLSEIVDETNARGEDWKPLCVEELKIFWALYFHTGHIHIPRLKFYWDKSALYNISFFPHSMPRDRFMEILDSLFKSCQLSRLMDHFHRRMEAILDPGREMNIGEGEFGHQLRLYMLAEKDGLVHRLVVYGANKLPQVKQVVCSLMSGFLNQGRSLFTERFCNTVCLTSFLMSQRTYLTGPLQPPNIPSVLSKAPQAYTQEGINVTKYQSVVTISSEFSGDMVKIEATRGVEQKPEVLCEYQKHKGGITRSNQHLGYFKRNARWRRKMSFHIVEVMMMNAFLLYKRSGDQMDFIKFRHDIVSALGRPAPPPLDPLSTPSLMIINASHTPLPLFKEGGKKKQKDCRWCRKAGITKRVTIACHACEGVPGLCLECFVKYHISIGFTPM